MTRDFNLVWMPCASMLAVISVLPATAQDLQAAPQLPLVRPEGAAAPPVVITLADALERARRNDAQYLSSVADAEIAREDYVQARAAALPAFSNSTQYLGNQANGVNPNGRFVSLDGVHMYREWAIVRQELSANTFTRAPIRKAQASEAVAQAKLEIARRGLNVTVTKAYHGLVAAERKYATGQQAAQQAARFLQVTQQQQRLGQVAQSDVVKAEIQFRQQEQNYQDAQVAMENARLTLAVLMFPTFNENFTVVDNRGSAPALPAFADVRAMAERANPDLRSASESLRAATEDVHVARNAFYPNLTIDGVYGIEANEFALHSAVAAQPELGVLPNLGYFVTVNLTVPIWDWGGLRSKLHQAETRERHAQVGMSQAQRQLLSNLFSMYNEALAARAAVDNFRRVADLATESLRLTNLRYGAGEATALEVVDAQNTLTQAENAFDDAETRYRVSLAELQTLTGSF
ncbi:MAG: TolC family protein [Blastocatellia bacterium]|nr:MAG: TolC family protein [Blastocatellia bacterium]